MAQGATGESHDRMPCTAEMVGGTRCTAVVVRSGAA